MPPVPGDRQPGLDLLEIRASVLRVPVPGLRISLLLDLVVPVQGDRRHVPVQLGAVDAELGDRLSPDRADDPLDLRRDGVQRPAEPVVVEQVRFDTEDLLHRPLPGPVADLHQRRGSGQTVGHQHLDDLAMGDMRDIAHRTQFVDDPREVQPAQKLGRGRQSAQTPLHHGGNHDIHPRTPHP